MRYLSMEQLYGVLRNGFLAYGMVNGRLDAGVAIRPRAFQFSLNAVQRRQNYGVQRQVETLV